MQKSREEPECSLNFPRCRRAGGINRNLASPQNRLPTLQLPSDSCRSPWTKHSSVLHTQTIPINLAMFPPLSTEKQPSLTTSSSPKSDKMSSSKTRPQPSFLCACLPHPLERYYNSTNSRPQLPTTTPLHIPHCPPRTVALPLPNRQA